MPPDPLKSIESSQRYYQLLHKDSCACYYLATCGAPANIQTFKCATQIEKAAYASCTLKEEAKYVISSDVSAGGLELIRRATGIPWLMNALRNTSKQEASREITFSNTVSVSSLLLYFFQYHVAHTFFVREETALLPGHTNHIVWVIVVPKANE